jgi:hypothetical protein
MLPRENYYKGRYMTGVPHPADAVPATLTKSALPSPPSETRARIPGQAIALRNALKAGCDRLNIPVATVVGREYPLGPELDHPDALLLAGWGTTWNTIDSERLKLAPGCLGWHAHAMPKLYFKHDERKTIGTVRSLETTSYGLFVQVVTDDPLARRASHFSLGMSMGEWELREATNKNIHVYVRSAWIEEVSMSTLPANPLATVVSRLPAKSYASHFYELAAQQVSLIGKLVVALEEQNARQQSAT